jgi:hypothetical protein
LEVWGHELTDESFARAEHLPGETAMQGLRHLLLGEGLDRDAIDARLARWCNVFSERYVPLLERTTTPHWRGAQRGGDARRAGANARPRAPHGEPRAGRACADEASRARSLLPPGTGAFGCEAEHRGDLIGLARRRAGEPPLGEIILVGDTPQDVEGAHAAGVRAIAVATGEYGPMELSDADELVTALAELPRALR